MIILTILLWNPLISWWDYFLYGEDPIDELENQSNIDPNAQAQNQPKVVKTFKPKAPMFLKRISDTLFVKAKPKTKNKKVNAFGSHFYIGEK